MPEIEMMHTSRGHATIHLSDETPEDRENLARKFKELRDAGHAIFLGEGKKSRRILGYDLINNEWILETLPEEQRRGAPRTTRASAAGTKPTIVARTAGG